MRSCITHCWAVSKNPATGWPDQRAMLFGVSVGAPDFGNNSGLASNETVVRGSSTWLHCSEDGHSKRRVDVCSTRLAGIFPRSAFSCSGSGNMLAVETPRTF